MEKETIIIVLIVALIFTILALLVLVGLLTYFLLKKSSPVEKSIATPKTAITPSAQELEQEAYREYSQGLCKNHPDIVAQGMCAICNELFCEKCLKNYEMLYFCTEHYQLFLNNKWVEIESIKSSPTDPVTGVALYAHKEKMWREAKIPSYIMTHYKIDIENDLIESHIKLFAKDTDRNVMQRNLSHKREHQ